LGKVGFGWGKRGLGVKKVNYWLIILPRKNNFTNYLIILIGALIF